MIIELFGPPGAGKTTFAQALKRHLREAGYIVEPVFSNRPAERNAAPLGGRPRKGGLSSLSQVDSAYCRDGISHVRSSRP